MLNVDILVSLLRDSEPVDLELKGGLLDLYQKLNSGHTYKISDVQIDLYSEEDLIKLQEVYEKYVGSSLNIISFLSALSKKTTIQFF